MTVLLAGDIGGTKTILRLVKADESGLSQETLHEQTYPSQQFTDLVPIVNKFLAEAKDKNMSEKPEKACFGIAGPVINNTCELTNLNWSLSGDRLEEDLGITKVKLLNDFAVIGYGILGLTKEDILTLQPGIHDKHAPIAVIGAGTGLGEAFLIPLPGRVFRVFSSEGSHADFAPRSRIEFDLLNYLLSSHNLQRVSVERVVSGMGIAAIYQFLRNRDESAESDEFGKIFRNWQQELDKDRKTIDLSAEISQAALTKKDPLCQQTMRLFVEAYGAEAGNLALKLLPYGGLYIAGGIAAKNLPLMKDGCFLAAFRAKGRLSPLMERIPVHIILNPKVGLIGAALFAAQISSDS